MSPVNLRNLGIPSDQPEGREGLFRTRRHGIGNLRHSGGWQDTEGYHTHFSLTFQFNRSLKPEDWKDTDKVLQLHQLLKDLFQWSMDDKRYNLESHLEKLGASCKKICFKEIHLKELMVITKGWNPTRQCSLLEERATRIRENQAATQAIEEQLNQTGPTLIPSG
ncbi:hypothetical protein O181_084667 [Austropuccinia psidii MF-1]|uniref:Uncharacterized protein n=1 Tax=Austropuccinia psidii MF-1 TaxID=1389203 RepID=A0A9Q3FWP4_9BASI|nr:hypothetical protein [Austropuccinia psidii MF-1]